MLNKLNYTNIFWLLWMCCGISMSGYIPKMIRPELSDSMWKGISLVVMFVFSIFNLKRKPFKTRIDRNFTFIIISIFISIGMGVVYHGQDMAIGLRASSVYFVFFTYFVLKRSTITEQEILTVVLIMGALQIVISILAILTIPNPIFGAVEIDEGRGGLRLRVGCFEWLLLILCYSCNQWFVLKKGKYKYWVILSYIVTFISLTRQYMAISSIVLLFYIVKGKSKIVKLLTISVFFACVVYAYNSEIGQSVIEMTIKQKEKSKYKEDDVRILDLRYFLDKGQTDIMTYLLGNGVYSPNDSSLGKYCGKNNYYPADVGMAGYIFYFGILSFYALLCICYYTIKIKKNEEDRFINTFIVSFLMCSVIAGSIVYANSLFILILMIYYTQLLNKNTHVRNSYFKLQH